MGDILRQYLKLIGRAFLKAALPSLITAYFLLFWYFSRFSADQIAESGASDLTLLLLMANITWTAVCYIYDASTRRYRIERMDREIVGKEFGGLRKLDRSFCDALGYLVQDDVMEALESFLALPIEKMTKQERGIVYFYRARCYQVTGCPANAVQNYRDAQHCGFDSVFLMLFLARSLTDGGQYDEAFSIYQELLTRNPKEFTCVRTDLGMLFLRKREGEKALEWFQDAIDRSENYAFALGGCSLAYLLLGNHEESQRFYEQAVINHMSDLEGFKIYRKELEELVAMRSTSAQSPAPAASHKEG